ncbi:hypothetical protein EW026_g5448 [Hermanssonia centrifuga]|uniref:Uncharacterized protein n=1 Tax=Hermanssonia centrifuga TaxID=98765 RepID=A0A4S4KIF7_9APHY|nr:hypothetical protein EW026_g5448 [Hermanssonia centrifuga]
MLTVNNIAIIIDITSIHRLLALATEEIHANEAGHQNEHTAYHATYNGAEFYVGSDAASLGWLWR